MKMAKRPFLVLQPPGQHLLCVGEDERQAGGVIGPIVHLVRIRLKIEEERRQSGEMDVFVALPPDDRQAALLRVKA